MELRLSHQPIKQMQRSHQQTKVKRRSHQQIREELLHQIKKGRLHQTTDTYHMMTKVKTQSFSQSWQEFSPFFLLKLHQVARWPQTVLNCQIVAQTSRNSFQKNSWTTIAPKLVTMILPGLRLQQSRLSAAWLNVLSTVLVFWVLDSSTRLLQRRFWQKPSLGNTIGRAK